VIGRWLAGHLALYPTFSFTDDGDSRKEACSTAIDDPSGPPDSGPASPSLHITSTVAVALRDIELISDTVD